jgi:hypothetical protein
VGTAHRRRVRVTALVLASDALVAACRTGGDRGDPGEPAPTSSTARRPPWPGGSFAGASGRGAARPGPLRPASPGRSFAGSPALRVARPGPLGRPSAGVPGRGVARPGPRGARHCRVARLPGRQAAGLPVPGLWAARPPVDRMPRSCSGTESVAYRPNPSPEPPAGPRAQPRPSRRPAGTCGATDPRGRRPPEPARPLGRRRLGHRPADPIRRRRDPPAPDGPLSTHLPRRAWRRTGAAGAVRRGDRTGVRARRAGPWGRDGGGRPRQR